MNKRKDEKKASADSELVKKVTSVSERKIRLKQTGDDKIWFGMGLMGLVGWSIAIPTLIGVLLGIWIDRRWPTNLSWTLMLLVGGIGLGCLNVWYWLSRQADEMDNESGVASTKQRKRGGP